MKNSIFKRILQTTICCFYFISVNCFAQSGVNDFDISAPATEILPPSPSAFRFATNGQIPLEGGSGAFSYSIPLYTIQLNDISSPLSVNYSSNGVKIDELATSIGTDWSLNAGGVITRVVKGVPDEEAQLRWYPDYVSHNGMTEEDTTRILQLSDYPSLYDSERDWFSFNVGGISGRFFFDEDLLPHIECNQHIKIEFEEKLAGTFGVCSLFTITDDKGIIYRFGGTDSFMEGVNTWSSKATVPRTKSYYTSWFLKEIESPKGDIVTFTYRSNDMSYSSGASLGLVFSQDCNNKNTTNYNSTPTDVVYYYDMTSRLLSEINFDGGSVTFNYNEDRPDGGGCSLADITVSNDNEIIKKVNFEYETVYTNKSHKLTELSTDDKLKYRLFLTKLTFLNKNEEEVNHYSFDYYNKESLPIRLSYSKDKYGFHNGSSNQNSFSSTLNDNTFIAGLLTQAGVQANADMEVNPNVVYYGMLKEITYPTGGYSHITYEANSDVIPANEIEYNEYTLIAQKNCTSNTTGINSFSFTATSDHVLEFSSDGQLMYFSGCSDVYSDPLHDYFTLKIEDLTASSTLFSETNPYGTKCLSDDYSSIQLQDGHNYQVTLKVLSTLSTAQGYVTLRYNPTTVDTENTIYSGGCRVKEIYDYADGEITNQRTFYYNSLSNYPSENTSLSDLVAPKYYDQITERIICDPGVCLNCYDEVQRITLSTSSLRSLYSNRRHSSFYSHITEFTSNGAIERQFFDVGKGSHNIILYPDISSTPSTNNGDGLYGILKKEYIYDGPSHGCC